jgi:hypothetical protein
MTVSLLSRTPALVLGAAVMATTVSGASGCNLGNVLNPVVDPVKAAVSTLDDAIQKITAVSGSWQTVLQSSLTQLTADAQSTVRNEVQTLLNNTIATVQVSVMCTVDFLGHRVVQALQEIKAELLHSAPPAPDPVVCSSTPITVEFAAWQQNRVPQVTLTGYDLQAPMQVTLVQTTGSAVVPNVLAAASQYQATINLGATGLKLTPQAQKISVQNTKNPPVELSGINVIQPQPKICEERDTPPEAIGPISLIADTHTSGDTEFNGNGPHVTIAFQMFPLNTTELHYLMTIIATETRSDFTEFRGFGGGTLSLNPPLPAGFAIISINGSTASSAEYTDTNTNDDHVAPNNGGPVREFVVVGDTGGDDFGKTGIKSVSFNTVGLHLRETGNCVTKTQAKTMIESGTVTPALADHLKKLLNQ